MLLIKGALALSLFVLVGLYSWLTNRMKLYHKAARSMALIQEYMKRLDRWQTARPFIHRGYCGYARHLIKEMIAAQEFLLRHGFSKDREGYRMLCSLLDEFPPDYDPPLAGGFSLSKQNDQHSLVILSLCE